MTESFKMPEKTRVRLAELYRLAQQAQKDFQGPLLTVLEFHDLDPNLNHQIDFDTGIIRPAEPLTKPELVKEEEAVS